MKGKAAYPLDLLLEGLSQSASMGPNAVRDIRPHTEAGVVNYPEVRKHALDKRSFETEVYQRKMLDAMRTGPYWTHPEVHAGISKEDRGAIIEGIANALVWKFNRAGKVTNDDEAGGFTLVPFALGQNLARLVRAMEAVYLDAARAGKVAPWGDDKTTKNLSATVYVKHHPDGGRHATSPMGSYQEIHKKTGGKRSKREISYREDDVWESNDVLEALIDDVTMAVARTTIYPSKGKCSTQELLQAYNALTKTFYHPAIS